MRAITLALHHCRFASAMPRLGLALGLLLGSGAGMAADEVPNDHKGLPVCYVLPDDAAELYYVVPEPNASPLPTSTLIPLSTIFEGEGAAYRAADRKIYAFDMPSFPDDGPNHLHAIDPDTGASQLVRSNLTPGEVQGAEFYIDPDSGEETLYLVADNNGRNLYAFDPNNNWASRAGYPKALNGARDALDSLAYDPLTGKYYGGNDDEVDIYEIDVDTAVTTFMTTTEFGVDGEGLAYAADQVLYIEDENDAGNGRRIYALDLGTGALTPAAILGGSGDVEALICNAGNKDDLGDAPEGYGIAAHRMPVSSDPLVFMGTNKPDDEPIGNEGDGTGDDSNGTDDEDGVTNFDLPTTAVGSYTLDVKVTNNGGADANLIGWIDFDIDGVFDADEAASAAVADGTSGGTVTLGWSIPGDAVTGDSYVRLRFTTDTALTTSTPATTAEDGEVEDYPIEIRECIGLTGDVSVAGPAVPSQVSSGDKVYVASSSRSPTEGHMKAYAIDSDGSVSSTAAWDAAGLMDATERQNRLYSTDGSGTITLLTSMDDAAFSSPGSPTVAKIKEFTLDPSVDGGAYLAGRKSGSFLGGISRGNDVALITQTADIPRILEDADYRSFYTNTVATRDEKVLVSSDDGFVYALNQSDGELAWGWIPRTLVSELQDYGTFQANGYMRGTLDLVDAKEGGSYASYLVGAYTGGLGHYVLKLSATAGLATQVWDEDRSSGFNHTAPNQGEVAYFRDGSGSTFVAYVVTNDLGLSTLVVRNLSNATAATEVALNFNATSTPFVMPDFHDANGPAATTLYLGDANGSIRRAALLDTGSLRSAAALKADLEGFSAGSLGAAEPIRFLGAAASSSDHEYYLRAQSDTRLTLLRYDSSNSQWNKRWTSYVTGAGSWDAAGTSYTADTSGAPTDIDGDGVFTNVTANGIQSLPAGATVTDAATIIADALILPVTTQPVAGNCFGRAFYYLYRLTDGQFPDDTFYEVEGTVIIEDLVVGFGEATRAQISDMPSDEKLVGYGHADQKPDNSTGITSSFTINERVATGMRGWKELRR